MSGFIEHSMSLQDLEGRIAELNAEVERLRELLREVLSLGVEAELKGYDTVQFDHVLRDEIKKELGE